MASRESPQRQWRRDPVCPQQARRCGSRGRGKRGTPTRAEILPDMAFPSPRYQITGEGWRRLSCQPCRGHESPVGSGLYVSGSCQEPVRQDIKDEPNRHSQSCWPRPTPTQAIILSQSILSRFFSVHILSFPRSVDSLFHSFNSKAIPSSLLGCQEKQIPLNRTYPIIFHYQDAAVPRLPCCLRRRCVSPYCCFTSSTATRKADADHATPFAALPTCTAAVFATTAATTGASALQLATLTVTLFRTTRPLAVVSPRMARPSTETSGRRTARQSLLRVSPASMARAPATPQLTTSGATATKLEKHIKKDIQMDV